MLAPLVALTALVVAVGVAAGPFVDAALAVGGGHRSTRRAYVAAVLGTAP